MCVNLQFKHTEACTDPQNSPPTLEKHHETAVVQSLGVPASLWPTGRRVPGFPALHHPLQLKRTSVEPAMLANFQINF